MTEYLTKQQATELLKTDSKKQAVKKMRLANVRRKKIKELGYFGWLKEDVEKLIPAPKRKVLSLKR